MGKDSIFFVYILECENGSLYTGITNDVQKRFKAHRDGKGGRYTRAHAPRSVVYQEQCGTRSEALKREAAIKRLSRAQKFKLVRQVSVVVQ